MGLARSKRRIRRALVKLRRATDGIAAVEFALLLPLMLLLYIGSTETMQSVIAARKAYIVARTVSDLVAQTTVTAVNTGMTDTVMGGIFNGAAAMMLPFPVGSSSLSMTVSAVSFETITTAPGSASPPVSAAADVWVPNQSATAATFTPTTTNPGYAAKVRWSVSPSTTGVATYATSLSGVGGAIGGANRSCNGGVVNIVPTTTAVPTQTPLQLSTGLYGSTSVIVTDVTYTYTPAFGMTLPQIGGNVGWNPSATLFVTHNTAYEQPRASPAYACSSTLNTGEYWVCYSQQTPTGAGTCNSSTY